jgi:NADH dehydrogenase FAD-containing subunit
VAAQQGKYLGRKLTKLAHQRKVLGTNGLAPDDEAVYRPFKYVHLGSLAYIGNAAVFDMGKFSFMGGLAAMYAWRSVYWSEQVSARTRALLMIDWIVRLVITFLYLTVAFQTDNCPPQRSLGTRFVKTMMETCLFRKNM